MSTGLVVDPTNDNTEAIEEVWSNCEKETAKRSPNEFRTKLIASLRQLACDAKESRAAIAKGVIRNWIPDKNDRGTFTTQLARGLLGEDGKPCAATNDLAPDDISKLREFVPKTESPGTAPATAPSKP